MADNTVDIKVRVTKTGNGVQEATADLRQLQAQAGGVASGIKTAFSSIGATFGALGLAGVGAAIVSFGRQSVMAASAASESINKMEVVFGGASDTINQFASGAVRNLGMSKQQATEAASTYGNLFTSMGVGKQAAADMSTGLVQLAADLGSFNNLGTDVMLEKIRAGMVGEVEPLRAVGMNLSAAAVQAKALAMGLANADGAISQSATLQARYALMLDQSRMRKVILPARRTVSRTA